MSGVGGGRKGGRGTPAGTRAPDPPLSRPQPAQGGKEASRSNALLHKLICDVLDREAPGVGAGLVALVTSRDDIDALLKLDDVIDLVIPRGGNALVRACVCACRS